MSWSVWTKTNNQELIDHNAGIDEFLIAVNLPTEYIAESLAQRLADLYDDPNVWTQEM